MGALQYPHLLFGVFAMFCYVGGEVAVGSFIISFLEQPQVMNLNEVVSKNYLSLYWGGAMICRFLGAISLNRFSSAKRKSFIYVGSCSCSVLSDLRVLLILRSHRSLSS
ncbi:hypothetical protein [Chryseobacterium indoltheticum]|uniref:hypothetical protein n=1 Tax=Chryseobacterium indoltheticum TaxID=254 RepID=UPI003F492103